MASNDESIESLKKKNAEMLAQIAAMRKRIIPNLRPTSIRASRPSTEIIKTRLDEVGVLYRQEVAEIPSPMATDKDLRFDYFIDQLHLAIEFDGAQHYHSVGLWGGEDELAMRRIYDKAKDEWCIQHHISMLRVPYDLDVAEIISWVDKALTKAYSTDKPFIWLVSPKSKKLVSFQDRYAGVPSLRDGKIVSSNTEDPVVSAFSNVAPMMVNKALNNQEASEVLDKELRDAGITLTADQNEVYLVFLAFTIYLQHQANKTEPPKITFANFKFFMRNKGYKMGQHTVDVRAIARDLTTPYPLPVNSLTEDYESVFWYLDRKTAKKKCW
ncbi:hypothetical protein [Schleiferilactobacillus harbinensis]|uniref:Uncharacterized protein n=1 Tax=Schleiferilactobacillus harbinensis TaxID=304207 RepID=A0A5P8M9T6_9LACO|nr:hypothetical protein [Schleiferilactobacillus harbinensis]QFR25107.1 hypothetical protein D1010_17895 [Schleiferilactobacillus harbinensis]